MKKLFFILSLPSLFMLNTARAQHQDQGSGAGQESFPQGTNSLAIGVGIGGEYGWWGVGYSSTPNLVISYENGIVGNGKVGPGTISIGGLLSYKGIGYSYTDPYSGYFYKQNWSYYILGIRGAYHWNFTGNVKFDPYAGVMISYSLVNYSFSSNDPYWNNPNDPFYNTYNNSYPSYAQVSLFLGCRYYVSSHIGLWAELGYGYTNLSLGINFKF